MQVLETKQERFLDLQGDITRSNANQVEEQLLGFLNEDKLSCLRLNMSNVHFIDSAGLGVLASAYSLAKNQNRQLTLCDVKPSVRLVFEITGLDKVVPLYNEAS